VQATASPRFLERTVSLYMLAMRGGISIGALLTGTAVTFFGVREALLFNGVAAIVLQAVLARMWFKAPMPSYSYHRNP
jgi:hypothetical protein